MVALVCDPSPGKAEMHGSLGLFLLSSTPGRCLALFPGLGLGKSQDADYGHGVQSYSLFIEGARGDSPN